LTSVHAEVASGPACELAEDAPPGLVCPAHPPSSNTVTSEARTGGSRLPQSLAIGLSLPGGVQDIKTRPEKVIPRVSAPLIVKYITDPRLLGLL
jgi:hypothetical protein